MSLSFLSRKNIKQLLVIVAPNESIIDENKNEKHKKYNYNGCILYIKQYINETIL